jgi:hypothetical protein
MKLMDFCRILTNKKSMEIADEAHLMDFAELGPIKIHGDCR